MNTNAYTEYDQEDFDYSYPIDFNRRNKYYLANRYNAKFSWNYGDPVCFKFYIDDIERENSVDISGWRSMADPVGFSAVLGTMYGGNQSDILFTGIKDNAGEKKVLVEFYNSDFEVVYSAVVFGSEIVEVNIDEEVSALVFYKGVFYCSLKILDSEDKVVKTILNSQDCPLYVR